MLKVPWLQQGLCYSLCIIAFAIPFPFIFAAIAIFLLSAVWLVQCNPKKTLIRLKNSKVLLLWMFFYLLHACSYFYSADKNQSFFDLQQKMTFVIFPFIIGAGINTTKDMIGKIGFSFAAGVSTIAIYSIAKAINIYQLSGATKQFFYHYLVLGLDANAVYESVYALFAIGILLLYPWQNKFIRICRLPMIFLLTIFLFLLSSRTLIFLFFFLLIPVFIVKLANKKKKNYIFVFILTTVIVLLAVALFKTDNPIRKRYTDITSSNIKDDLRPKSMVQEGENFNNLSLRIFLWKTAYENIKQHNLWLKGAGNGGMQILQNKKLAEKGIPNIYTEKDRSPLYNISLHNMYIQILMILGIGGLLVLLILAFAPFFNRPHTELYAIIAIFNIIFIFLMLQESALQTQAGIVFYLFFYTLFYNFQSSSALLKNKST